MKIQQFNGGLATRLAPQLIKTTQSVVYLNADSTTGELRPVKDKTLVEELIVDKFFKYFRADEEYVSSDTVTDYLEFQGFMLSADRVGYPQKRRSGVTSNLGIVRPSSAPELTKIDYSALLKSATITSSDEELLVGPSNDPNNPYAIRGDLPSTALEYRIYIEKAGLLSAAHEVTVQATNSGTLAFVSDIKRWEEAQRDTGYVKYRDFLASSYENTSRVVTVSVPYLPTGETLVVYRLLGEEWIRIANYLDRTNVTDSVYQPEIYEVLDEDSVTNFSGTYQYVYTYYNEVDGTESAPSDVTEELDVSSGYIRITLPSASDDPQVTHNKIYRVGGNITTFSLVATVEADVLEYNDKTNDVDLPGNTLLSDNFYEAPLGLKYLTESYAMVFGALGEQLRFTPVAKHNAWPPEYSLSFDSDITGIGAVSSGLLVMTADKTHLVTGSGPFSLSTQTLRGDQGCIAHESIQQVSQGAVVWASSDGLCVSSGGNPQNITKYQLGNLKLNPTSSSVLNEVYYLHNNDGTIFVWDYRFEPVFQLLDLDVEYIQKVKGALYGYKEGQQYELMSSEETLEFDYLSPKFIEGSFTERKMYNKVFLFSSGSVSIEVLIDDEVVLSKLFSDKGPKELKVPQDKQSGYYIQFRIRGSGIVSELEYEVGRRKNG